MSEEFTVSIIVPVYNESRCLPALLKNISTNLKDQSWNYQILIVDDGSSDDTWSVITQMQGHYELTALKLSRNFGKEAALCAGLEHAEGDAFITIDADLQHPPELIPVMVQKWRESQCDLVEAVKDRAYEESRWSRFQAWAFYRCFAALCGTDIEGHTDFKLMSARAREAWMRLPERGMFFRGLTTWLGFEREKVHFRVPDAPSRSSRWSGLQLLKYAVKNITAFSSLPLIFLLVAGFLFLIPASVTGIWTLYLKYTGQAVDGFTTVIVLMNFFGGLNFLGLSLLGLYVAQVYDEVKARPRYLLSDRLGL